MSQTGDDATIIQAVEMIGSDAVVLGSIPVTGKGTYRISFKPTGSSVQLWVLGAYDILLNPTCYTYPVTTQETYLVGICDENKDRYRFGFNGMEKDNELKGIGNSLDYGARIYDSRTGRFLSLDPEANEMPWQSAYLMASGSPIDKIDPDGEWDITVHAHRDRSKYGYATMIVTDNDGKVIYRTIVKTVGSGRVRNKTNGDTPQGKYKILEWRETGGKRYPTKSFGPNNILALDYRGKEGKGRNGMHIHGGRGYYADGKALMSTHGCMRINDNDIKELKKITDRIERLDPTEKKGFLTLVDDLSSPVKYDENRHGTGSSKKVFNSYKAHIIDAGEDGYTNLRPNPGSGEATRVDAGTEVKVIGTSGNYTKIQYKNQQGYVPSRYVQKG